MSLFRRLVQREEPEEAAVSRLSPDAAARIRTSMFSRFSSTTLARHAENNPHLAWWIEGTSHYAIGGYWRRRQEIGEVLEVARGPYRRALVRRLIEAFRGAGAELVVLDFDERTNDGDFYAREGFQSVDKIIEYELLMGPSHPVSPQESVRRGRIGDIDAILEIEHNSFPWLWWNSPAELDNYMHTIGVDVFLVLDEGLPVGYSGMTVRGTSAHLDRLAVHNSWQGRGLGRALLIHSLAHAHNLGVRRVTLSTQATNYRSQSLYEGFGFRRGRWMYDISGLWLTKREEVGG